MKKAKIIFWHRRLSLIAGMAVLIWGLSGLLHPLMSWTNPHPAAFTAPAVQAFPVPAKGRIFSILRQHDIGQAEGLRVIGGALQVTLPGRAERLYFDLKTGQLVPQADRDRAIMLARHYTGLADAAVLAAVPVTSFSHEYTYINRYLPVWKISFGDSRRITAYVDTGMDRLGSITDTRKVVLQTLFQILHTGQWLDGAEPLRLALIAVLVGSVLCMSLAGLYMMVFIRGQRRGARKVHRLLAYAALFPLLMFPASGLFHLFVQSPLVYGASDEKPAPAGTDSLRYMPKGKADDLRLLSFNGQNWWRAQNGQDIHYMNSADGGLIEGDENFVRHMVSAPVKSISLINSFSDEYGFAYKRLPVWRVETGRELLFIEDRSATVAARTDFVKAAETWSFSRFHKWQFLDKISENIMEAAGAPPAFKIAVRDAVLVIFMLLGLGMALIGLFLRPRPRT